MSEPIRYHVAPDANEATRCYAKKKCRYGFPLDDHPDTPAAALEWVNSLRYGEVSETKHSKKPTANSANERQLSEGGSLLLQLTDLTFKISEYSDSIYDDDGPVAMEQYRELESIVSERDTLEEELRNLPWNENDAPRYDDTVELEFQSLDVGSDPHKRQGVTNSIVQTKWDEQTSQTYEHLRNASREWVSRLSTAEIQAVWKYNKSSDGYSKMVIGEMEPDEQYLRNLHSALEKAPKLKKPLKVYAGVSGPRAMGTIEQGESGYVTLRRLQSSSVNPAIINSFMHPESHFDEERNKRIALEFDVERCASLTAWSTHYQEMEVLVPPNHYQVVKRTEQVDYLWDGGSGQTADYVYELQPLRQTQPLDN